MSKRKIQMGLDRKANQKSRMPKVRETQRIEIDREVARIAARRWEYIKKRLRGK